MCYHSLGNLGRLGLVEIQLRPDLGGFRLGLERAGMETVAFCEIDPAAREILALRWPGTIKSTSIWSPASLTPA